MQCERNLPFKIFVILRKPKRGGKFMEGVPGVTHFTLQPKLSTIQKKIQVCPFFTIQAAAYHLVSRSN